jgi:3-oxoadipate enol-lactonase
VPFIRAGGRTVYYDLAGPAGAPVVAFGNSLGTSVAVWDDVVAPISATLRTLRFDMRGHGLTDEAAAPSMDDLARDAVALFDALGIDRVRFVGLSIGGMIGQRLAAEYPDRVDALVLCATANKIGAPATWNERIAAVERDGMPAVRDGVLARWFTPQAHENRPDLIRGFANMLSRTTVSGYAGACAAIRDADLAADDARIACPTLAIAGGDDPVTPPADAFALRDAIAGARAVVIDGAAHIVPAQCPSEFLDIALPFLTSPSAAAQT